MNPVESLRDTLSADEIRRLHEEYLFPCVNTYYEQALPLVRGEGMYVTDADGAEFLDFFAGILTVSVGHCNEQVTEAVKRQAETLQHVSGAFFKSLAALDQLPDGIETRGFSGEEPVRLDGRRAGRV